MICTIFFFNSISSVATPANPPALALWASWLMLLASPASFRNTSASALLMRCTTLPVSNTEWTNLLSETPASFLRFYRLVLNICKSCADHTHLVALGLP